MNEAQTRFNKKFFDEGYKLVIIDKHLPKYLELSEKLPIFAPRR